MSNSQQNNGLPTPLLTGEVPRTGPLDTADRILDGLLTRVYILSSEMIVNHAPGINATETLHNVQRVIIMYAEIEKRLISHELTNTLRQSAEKNR